MTGRLQPAEKVARSLNIQLLTKQVDSSRRDHKVTGAGSSSHKVAKAPLQPQEPH